MNCSLNSVKGFSSGFYMGALEGLLRGILGV